MDVHLLLSSADDTPTSTPSPRSIPANLNHHTPTSTSRTSGTHVHRPSSAQTLAVPTESHGIPSFKSMSPPERPGASHRTATGMDMIADVASMQHPLPGPRSTPIIKRTYEGFDNQRPRKPPRPSLEAIARMHSGSRSSLDIHMEETPVQAPRSRNFQSSSLSPEDLHTVQQLTKYLAEHPSAYQSHLQLIKILHQGFLSHIYSTEGSTEEQDPTTYDLLPELIQAREAMASRFNMGEEMWLERIQDDMLLARTLEDCLQIVEHCEKAVVEEAGSTKLWTMFGNWELALYSTANPDDQSIAQLHDGLNKWINLSEDDRLVIGEVFGKTTIIDVWRRGAEDVKHNINDSYLVWNKYTELLQMELEQHTSAESVTTMRQHFIDRLRQPHSNWDDTFQLFSSFISKHDNASYEETMVKTTRLAANAKAMFAEREMLEIKLARSLETGDKTAAWLVMNEYLDWEMSRPRRKNAPGFSFDLANALYQRATLLFPSDTDIWEDHLVLLGENEQRRDRISSLTLLGRACGHCPWSGKLWSLYIQAAERHNLNFADIGQIKHKATSTGLLDSTSMEDILAIHTTWCNFLRRRAFSREATDEEAETAEMGIVSAIEDMEKLGQKKEGENYSGDQQYRLERIYIKFLAQSRQFDLARSVWEKLAQRRGNLWEFWMRWYTWEIHCWSYELGRTGTPSQQMGPMQATNVLLQAAKNAVHIDWPEKILDAYLVHCQDHESVSAIESAMIVWRRAMKDVAKRREKEAADHAAEQEAHRRTQSNVEMADVTLANGYNTKRKREDDQDNDSNQEMKKQKGTQAESSQTPEVQPHTKRDRENSIVVVRNLPAETPENWIQHYFKECGTIQSILLLLNDSKGTSTASVEFESKQDALSALTKDGKPFHGNIIEVLPGTKTTLWVVNFPPEADEAWIRELFKQYGEIIDIRLPSKTYNSRRRFCYVQFTSSEDAQAATVLDNSTVDGGLKLGVKISNPSLRENRHGAEHEGREVFVRNVDWKATEAEVQALFKPYGAVERVRIPRTHDGKSRGSAYVTFSSKEEAEASLALTETKFNSRIITVSIADPNVGKHSNTTYLSNTSHKSASPAPIGEAMSPDSAISSIQPSDRKTRTIALINIPDTISTARLQSICSPYGTIEQITLRLDHQGAIIVYTEAASAGKAALNLEGHEIAPGRQITIVPVDELFKQKAEIKDANPGVKKSSTKKVLPATTLSTPGPIKRPTAVGSGRRGGLGQRRGGFSGKSLGGSNEDSSTGKSNEEFRNMVVGAAASAPKSSAGDDEGTEKKED